ncbi:hypothetical protein C8F04DRAFT_1255837 [Mycena alexandri]|uniref:F-box domain-containing protein n=1 Tax=Mycena alexandri TaxID=1745969 RepID=A0AAD6XAW8_9AGAR|nr:hypothetical protein C8F04DRAFT_1255837 [Mycena alexandri]
MSSAFGALAALSLTCPYLPPEILSDVFRRVCSEHDPTLRLFRIACYRLSHVCQRWRDVACSEPYLWRTLVVDESTSSEYLDAFLLNSGRRPIAVAFALFRNTLSSHSDLCRSLVASAIHILPSLPRWAALELYIDDQKTMDTLTAFFATQRAPRLRFLSIACRALDLEPVGRLPVPGPLLFDGELHRLEHVALDGVPLPRVLLSPMLLLVNLTLDGIPPSSWPTYPTFIRLVTQSPSLRSVCLNGIGFSGTLPSAPVVVDHVVHLDLSFGFSTLESGRTTLLLLSVLIFTRLESLRLSLRDTSAITAFLSTSLRFSARRVCLEGVCSDDHLARSLYIRLFGVLSLDLRRGHPAMVAALQPYGTLLVDFPLPSLTSLLLYEPDWHVLLAACLWFLLPYELRLYIFDMVFACRKSSNALRTKVCGTSSAWRRFVRSHPHYWTRVLVTSRIPQDDVLSHIALAGNLPLRFHIIFNSSDPVVDLGYLAPHMLVATHFTVESDDRDTLCRLHQSFQGVRGPLLRHFALFFRRAQQSVPRDCTPLLPRTWFSGQHQALEVLHLCCAVIPFADLHFPALRVFRIWGVHPQYSLDVRALSVVICNSPVLQDLTLRRFTCTGLRDVDTLPAIRSTTLSTLELGFSCDGTIGRLATLFDFPSLSELFLEISNTAHVDQVRALRPRLLARVTSLTIRNPRARYMPFEFSSIDVFPLFPCLRALNLRLSQPHVFTDLARTTSEYLRTHDAVLIPGLTYLTVNYATMCELFEFTSCYPVGPDSGHPRVSLKRLHAGLGVFVPFGPATMEEDAAATWLSSHVAEFIVDPIRLTVD